MNPNHQSNGAVTPLQQRSSACGSEYETGHGARHTVENGIDLSVDVDSDLEELLDGGTGLNSDPTSAAEGETNDEQNDAESDEFARLVEEAQGAWTDEDVDEIMLFLKERGMVWWMKHYLITRREPVQKLLYAFGVILNKNLRQKDDVALLPLLKLALNRVLRQREKLPQYNTIDDVLHLLRSSRRIIVLTGAGISVSCGIPDFRSRNGLYSMLQEKGEYDLDDPQQMFDIDYFRKRPSIFYQIYPSNFTPSPCHRFIKVIEEKGKLLRNYTQNIDTLETLAGIERVLQCHGSFATATCIQCRHKVPGTDIKNDILAQNIPICTKCNMNGKARAAVPPKKATKKKRRRRSGGWDSDQSDEPDDPPQPLGIMKPDITFFGEKLTDDFDRLLFEDRESVDLLLVIGTSLKVAPVSDILTHLPHSVPQVVINKTPIKHINPDVVLLGDADGIVQYLSSRLEWSLVDTLHPAPVLRKRPSEDTRNGEFPRRVGQSHAWLFEGADGGSYVEALEAAFGDMDGSGEALAQAEGCVDGRNLKKSRHV